MDYTKIILKAVAETSFHNEGVSKFKIPGELTYYQKEEVLKIFKNHMYSDEKVVTEWEAIYNDESFTQFIFKFKKATLEKIYEALMKMEEIANNFNNMHGDMIIDTNIKSIMNSL